MSRIGWLTYSSQRGGSGEEPNDCGNPRLGKVYYIQAALPGGNAKETIDCRSDASDLNVRPDAIRIAKCFELSACSIDHLDIQI